MLVLRRSLITAISRLVLDEALHAKDGSLTGKAHYEEAMIRK